VACDVWRVACDVWRVACDVLSLACGVWRVTCGVWRVACDVWRVACDVWRVTFDRLWKVFVQLNGTAMLSVGKLELKLAKESLARLTYVLALASHCTGGI
jgi:hypothetical protein